MLLVEVGSVPVAGQTPQIVNVTIESAPEPGPGFVWVDDVFVTTPVTYAWHVGDTHLLTAAIETRVDNDCSVHQCDLWFQSWSDNGYRNHTITVAPTTTIYTAFFLKRNYVFVSGSPASLSDIQVDGTALTSNPQFFGWSPGSTHQLTAFNTIGQFVYWASPSVTQIAMNTITYTVPADGENITAYYIPQNSTTTTTVTTSNPNVEQITVTTNPSSQGIISVDGTTIDTPQIYSWQIGSTHYLVAPQTAPGINCDGCEYQFLYWYATSSREHDSNLFLYTTPSWSETVTAFYQLEESTLTSTASTTTSVVTVFSTPTSQVTPSPDFVLSASPSSVSLPPNNYVGSAGFTLTLTSVGDWAGQVQFTTSALPAGITTSDLPLSYQLSPGGVASWDVFVNIGTSAQTGTYQLVVTGISGSLIHSAVVTVSVSSPSTAVPEFPSSASLGLLVACIVFVSVAVRRRRG